MPFLGDALAGQDKIAQVDVYLVQGVRLLIRGVSKSTVNHWPAWAPDLAVLTRSQTL